MANWVPNAQSWWSNPVTRPLASKKAQVKVQERKKKTPQPPHCSVPGLQEQTSHRNAELCLVLFHASQWLKMSPQQRLPSVQVASPLSVLVRDEAHRSQFAILPCSKPLPWDFAFPAARDRSLPPPTTDLGFGHLTCFGQWNVSRREPCRGMTHACVVGLALCTSHHHGKSHPWTAAA